MNAMRSIHGRMVALVCALGFVIAAAATAHAGPYEDALAGFTEGTLSDTGDAIDKIVAGGDPRAAILLAALEDARVLFSAEEKKVYIKTNDGKLTDAATGTEISTPPPDDLDTVIVNNRLRNSIDAAIGGLTLMAADPNKRYDAAQAVFKSRELGALPNLDKALAKETDPRVKKALAEARAAVVLYSADSSAADKIAAIAVIGDRGDQDALGLLDGLPANLPANVH